MVCVCAGVRGSGESQKALSHDVDKELAGVAHSMLEGLATGGELRGHSRQLPPGGGARWRAAADRGLGGC